MARRPAKSAPAIPRPFWGAAVAFALTDGLVIVGSRRFVALASTGVVATAPPIPLLTLLLWFLGATAVLFLLLRAVRSRVFFTVLFGAALAGGIMTLAGLWFPLIAAIVLAVAIVVFAMHDRRVWSVDCLLVLGAAGVAISLGAAVMPATAVALLVALAFYDIIAVYRTRHMVTMARALIRRGAVFALIVPDRLAGLGARAKEAEGAPGFFLLGTGDLALPAVLVASTATVSLPAAVLAAAGSLVGLAVLTGIFFSQRLRRPMPALPPIATGTILGYLLGILL